MPFLSLLLACSLAHPRAFGYDSLGMESEDHAGRSLPCPLAPASQTACYSPSLKARVLIRAALTTSWSPEAWAEVHALLAEERRLRRQGWLN